MSLALLRVRLVSDANSLRTVVLSRVFSRVSLLLMPKNLLSLLWLLRWEVSCTPSMISEPLSLMTLASVPPRTWLPLTRTSSALTINLPAALIALPSCRVLP
ncbi:hypothetical protein D3C87_1242220 [compost metagenome]